MNTKGGLLSGERVRLRAMEPEDLELIYKVENLTDFWHCGSANVPYSRYALKQFISESQNNIFADGQLRLIIETVTEPQPVGCVDLTSFDAMHSRSEVGVLLLPQWQGRGLGSEVLQLLCEYAHERLHLHQLYAYVAESNVAATNLFQKVAFQEVACLPAWLRNEDGYVAARLFQKIFV